MLSILADALLLAIGHRAGPAPKSHDANTDWSDRFSARDYRKSDLRGDKFNAKRDLQW